MKPSLVPPANETPWDLVLRMMESHGWHLKDRPAALVMLRASSVNRLRSRPKRKKK